MNELRELMELLGDQPLYQYPTSEWQDELLTFVRDNPNACEETLYAHLDYLSTDRVEPTEVKESLRLAYINSLTAITPYWDDAAGYRGAYRRVWKLLTAARLQQHDVTSRVVLPYLEEAFTLAEEHEILGAAFQCAALLQRLYANRLYDESKYRYYVKKMRRAREVYLVYTDLLSDLNEVSFRRNQGGELAETGTLARRLFEKHRGIGQRYGLVALTYPVFVLEINTYLLAGDFRGVIDVAQRAIDYLQRQPKARPKMFEVFDANLAVAYTHIDDYDNGLRYARSMLARAKPSEYNYIKVHELLITLHLRSRQFQQAYESYAAMDREVVETLAPQIYQETFMILEGYLYLLVRLGRITPATGDTSFERFRLARFVNGFAHTPDEKQGRNLHLLIIRLIGQIVERQHGKVHVSLEAISKYGQRHLRGRGYDRVMNFLKALAQVAEQQFHRAAVERRAGRYIERMSRHPLQKVKAGYYVELVPYETLWAMVLENLGGRRVRRRTDMESMREK